MTRFADRNRAIQLRKQEKSYSQIKKILNVSKGTLSVWLQDYPLSQEKIRELRDWNEQRIEKFRETMRRKREHRLRQVYDAEKSFLIPLNKRELYIAGLLLYWGEGLKAGSAEVSLSNTNPAVIKFFMSWLEEAVGITKPQMRVYLHLYSDMDVKKEMGFWSRTLRLPLKQFTSPYIKTSSSKRIFHKGTFGHGTCNLRVGSVVLKEKIMMGLKAISDKHAPL